VKRIVLRADGGSDVGLGHVMRMYALAEHARASGFAVTLVSASLPARLRARLASLGVDVVVVDVEVGAEADADACVAACADADAFVGDGYRFDAAFYRRIADANVVVAALDDHGTAVDADVDVVLNQNLSAGAYRYRARHVLRGPRFALLRREFATVDERPPTERRVAFAFGGADVAGLVPIALDAVAFLAEYRAVFLVGGATRNDDLLKKSAVALGDHVDFLVDVEHVSSIVKGCSAAVVAAGSTTWEMCALGIPQLIAVVAENQRAHAAALVEAGAALQLQLPTSAAAMAKAVTALLASVDLREKLRTTGRQLVDGLGAPRFLDALAAA
jgi:UDP-2,4-diacetamido-2,4,6-trideoxy-beta-L-altropyranose hydrolase